VALLFFNPASCSVRLRVFSAFVAEKRRSAQRRPGLRSGRSGAVCVRRQNSQLRLPYARSPGAPATRPSAWTAGASGLPCSRSPGGSCTASSMRRHPCRRLLRDQLRLAASCEDCERLCRRFGSTVFTTKGRMVGIQPKRVGGQSLPPTKKGTPWLVKRRFHSGWQMLDYSLLSPDPFVSFL